MKIASSVTIHLIRHAEAIPRTAEFPEPFRYLTCRGRARFRRVAAALKKQQAEPDLIYTSPLVRSVQTAEILAETIRFCGDLRVVPALGPGFTINDLRDIIGSSPQCEEIALVGHEPDLGMVARTLLNAELPCSLKKGGAVSFRVEPDRIERKAEFFMLVTGGGKVVTDRGKALERLQAPNRQ